jgi:hypothetical protein
LSINVLLLLACAEVPATVDTGVQGTDCRSIDVTVTPTAMPTVLRAAWETDEDTEGYVLFAGRGQVARRSATTSGQLHEVLLVGLRPATEVAYTVWVDGMAACGGEGSTTTGALDVGFPTVAANVTTMDAEQAGLTVVPLMGKSASGAVILDEEGAVVWAAELGGGGRSVFKATPSLDGDAVLFNESANGFERPGVLYRLSLDGERYDSFEIVGGHTDFVERAPHEYTMLGWEIREFEGRRLLGDTLVEFDESGGSRVVWNAFDAIEVDLSRSYDTGWFRSDPTVEDWTHVNGLSYSAAEDSYYLTMTLDDAVARVSRSTGEMTWRMATGAGDFTSDSESAMFVRPHSVQPLDGSVLVFNRGRPNQGAEACSDVVQVAYDMAAGTMSKIWSHTPESCITVESLGSAQRLGGGNTLICFSSAGRIDEVDDVGDLVLSLSLPAGSTFGFAARVDEPVGSLPRRP